LIGPKEVFLHSAPEYTGGGTVDVVTLDEVHWAGVPDREEAGSPNVVGAVAMAAAAQALMAVGMDAVAAHEQELLAYAIERMQAVPGMHIYGETNPARLHEKVGVIPFNMTGISHFLVAAILGYEGGIGVRSGCFCAHPYVVHFATRRAYGRDVAQPTAGRRQVEHAWHGAGQLRLLQQHGRCRPAGGDAAAHRCHLATPAHCNPSGNRNPVCATNAGSNPGA
jgi:hypothetical protein